MSASASRLVPKSPLKTKPVAGLGLASTAFAHPWVAGSIGLAGGSRYKQHDRACNGR